MKNTVLALLFTLLAAPVFSGNTDNDKTGTRTLSGRVVSEEGEALPGAVITVKETGEQFFADLDGRFQISLPVNAAYSVTISTIGFHIKEVKSGDINSFGEHTLQPLQ